MTEKASSAAYIYDFDFSFSFFLKKNIFSMVEDDEFDGLFGCGENVAAKLRTWEIFKVGTAFWLS